MAKEEKKALLKIPVQVSTHSSTETDEKAEVCTVTMKSIDGLFYIAMGEAKAQLKIKVKDDIIKHNFPLSHEYILEIYPREVSESEPKPKTEPTTLDEHAEEQESEEEESVDESSESPE